MNGTRLKNMKHDDTHTLLVVPCYAMEQYDSIHTASSAMLCHGAV